MFLIALSSFDPAAGFLNGFDRQFHVLVLARFHHLVGDVVDLFLVEVGHDVEGLVSLLDELVDHFLGAAHLRRFTNLGFSLLSHSKQCLLELFNSWVNLITVYTLPEECEKVNKFYPLI